MRVLSWNILHGGGQRIDGILKVIEHHNPDVVTLQEYRHRKNNNTLCDGLRALGLDTQFAPPTENARDNTLLLASCYDFEAQILRPDTSSATTHVIRAQFRGIPLPDMPTFELFCVHFPHKKLQIPCFQAFLDLPDGVRENPTLLVGDFNCGIPFEDSQTQSFYASQWFQQLLQQGWVDAWRSRHQMAREFSWVSTQKKNGFRYDHALASKSLNALITGIGYDHKPRIERLSDHSCLWIDF